MGGEEKSKKPRPYRDHQTNHLPLYLLGVPEFDYLARRIVLPMILFDEFPLPAMMSGLLTRSPGQEPGLSFPVPFW